MSGDYELTRFNVVSSRIRLARNVRGLPFPRCGKGVDRESMLGFMRGAESAAKGLIEYNFYFMKDLTAVKKLAMVERHLISPALADNSSTGALILEKSEGISVMLNEEDHIREQCVAEGFNLSLAYKRIDRYDDRLLEQLPVAFDEQLGFLTACPTNLGTGMRASTMLFLPALKLAGAIEAAILKFTQTYGLTIRGVYGEGSKATGDMYQLSNTRSLGLDENSIINIVERATIEMCMHEQAAREKLAHKKGVPLIDKIWRSYGILTNAYKLSSAELMNLISDVKLGIILNILPIKETRPLDKLLVLCSAANLTLTIGECTPTERDIARAKLVRGILAEAK